MNKKGTGFFTKTIGRYRVNSPDRTKPDILGDKEIQKAAQKIKDISENPKFFANNKEYFICRMYDQDLENIKEQDEANSSAFYNGYRRLHTFLAVKTGNRKAYGVFEFYERNGDNKAILDRVIEVDHNHQRIGIGKGFLGEVLKTSREDGYAIETSEKYTEAGAALLNSLDRK